MLLPMTPLSLTSVFFHKLSGSYSFEVLQTFCMSAGLQPAAQWQSCLGRSQKPGGAGWPLLVTKTAAAACVQLQL